MPITGGAPSVDEDGFALAVAVVVGDAFGVIASTLTAPSGWTTILHVPTMHCSPELQSVWRRHADEQPSVIPMSIRVARSPTRGALFMDS